MKTSKLFTALAGMAVVAFPVTIAIVTIGASNSAQKVQSSSSPGAAAQDSSSSSAVGKEETKSSRITEEQTTKTPTQAVVQALRVRVKELGEAIDQAKVEEVQLKVALAEKQVFQKVTARNLKATQRAIKEIEGTTSTSPTLREPKPAQGQQRQSIQGSLPDGWQVYLGKLGRGFGRPYSLAELDQPREFINTVLGLPATERVPAEVSRGEEKATFKRIVYLSGVDSSDPRLEDLRKIGESERLEFKRVRSDVPLFDGLYLMVQVIPQLVSLTQPAEESASAETVPDPVD
jgi:hypothetical protein